MRVAESKKEKLSFGVFVISFFMIVIGIIFYRPSPLLFIPLLVSAGIMFLQARVNRYAFMVGAINAGLYAIAYMKMSLYTTALYAILVSCPLQLMIFVNWSRYTKQSETELRKMSVRSRIRLFCGMFVGWLLLYVIFSKWNSQYLLLDNSVAVLGTICTVLCALRFKEYTFLQILTNIISFITYLMMLEADPSRIIWVISSVNAMVCTCIAWSNMNEKEKMV